MFGFIFVSIFLFLLLPFNGFRGEVAIFYKSIPDGVYEIEIPLSPRFGGTYSINPAQAFMMYNPDNQGNTAIKVVEVE